MTLTFEEAFQVSLGQRALPIESWPSAWVLKRRRDIDEMDRQARERQREDSDD